MYNFCIIHIEHLHIYLYTIPYLCNIEAPPKGSTPPLWFSWTSCASFASSSWAKMAKRGRSWEVYLPYKLYIVRKYTSIQYDDDSKINYHHCFMIIAMISYDILLVLLILILLLLLLLLLLYVCLKMGYIHQGSDKGGGVVFPNDIL